MINILQEWKSGSGQKTSFQQILQIMKQHSKKNGTVYIGTDSFFVKDQCTFSNAICLYGADGQKGGRYFFAKRKEPKKAFSNLAIRMLKEAEETIEIARAISEENPKIKLELHLDISSSDKQEKTSHLAKMLIGYVNGSGYDCRIKPHAFAANSIADRHSK
tara:strand:+ start:1438 stop:1920 length:483 start_codon:yes stop_codon:yes gene_type:complete